MRGDSGTVAAHLASLAGMPEALAAYRAMAQATADLAYAGGRLAADGYASVIAALSLSEGAAPQEDR